MRASPTLGLVALALLAACADKERENHGALDASTPPPVEESTVPAVVRARGPLVDPTAWEVVPAAEDPFADRPPDASCPDGSYMPENLSGEDVFSVDTGGCSYITARQPALRDIAPGESFNARVWHFTLNAGESAMAHVALRVGETTLLDQTVPIPSPGGLLAIEHVADSAIPKDTPIYFHLHNHGDNSWSLVELSAGPAEP